GLREAAIATAKATGKAWEDLAKQRLYQRLGMKQTSSRFEDYKAASNRAWLHVVENGQWIAKYTRGPDAQTTAGGVSSTVRDLAQWVRLQLGNGVYAGEKVIDADALASITFSPAYTPFPNCKRTHCARSRTVELTPPAVV